MTSVLAAAAAVVVVLWPQIQAVFIWATGLWQGVLNAPLPKPHEEAVAPSYQSAIVNLAAVRLRLRMTDRLGDEQKKAVDALTLALVDGSDQ